MSEKLVAEVTAINQIAQGKEVAWEKGQDKIVRIGEYSRAAEEMKPNRNILSSGLIKPDYQYILEKPKEAEAETVGAVTSEQSQRMNKWHRIWQLAKYWWP